MSWLVTGGAGYIGAHVVRAFQEVGLDAVVIDDLSSGHRSFVQPEVPFVEGSIVDTELVVETLEKYAVEGVVHLAGFKYAGVSVDRPLHTYTQNVTGTINLLEAMERTGVESIVFSSSAATFGTPDVELVTEQTATLPESPYGESKLIGEWLIRDQARATTLRHTSLRYFNVVGSGSTDIFDTSPHNLFPIVFEMLLDGKTPRINGDDYDTPDGTCVRDYVHVADLAEAHVVAARHLAAGDPLRAGLQPRQRHRVVRPRDHGRDPRGDRHRLHPRDRTAPTGRPRPHRRHRRGGGARPRLADAALARGHGAHGLAGPQQQLPVMIAA